MECSVFWESVESPNPGGISPGMILPPVRHWAMSEDTFDVTAGAGGATGVWRVEEGTLHPSRAQDGPTTENDVAPKAAAPRLRNLGLELGLEHSCSSVNHCRINGRWNAKPAGKNFLSKSNFKIF